jgi:hypothetical protein
MHTDTSTGAKCTQTFRSAPCGVPRLLAVLLGAYVPPIFSSASSASHIANAYFADGSFFLLSSTKCCQVQVEKEIRIWCREFRFKEDL